MPSNAPLEDNTSGCLPYFIWFIIAVGVLIGLLVRLPS